METTLCLGPPDLKYILADTGMVFKYFTMAKVHSIHKQEVKIKYILKILAPMIDCLSVWGSLSCCRIDLEPMSLRTVFGVKKNKESWE